jgi:membrane-associated phospholipid phosphatase
MSPALGCLMTYAALAVRYSGPASRRERALFERINSRGEHRWLRLPQQWGTPWTLPLVALLAIGRGRVRVALAALACLPVEKAIEVTTKRWRKRPRPVYVQATALRDDAPVEGGSMPSGHSAIAACGTVLMASTLPAPIAVAAAAATVLTAWTRVHQGAHEPADVIAGLVLGTGIGLGVLELTEQAAQMVSVL